MNMRLLGGILLITGSTIGGGMLALPIAAAQMGFVGSSILLFTCWCIMTASAFLLLEINLWLPRNNNVISMAKATLGRGGQVIAWVVYLLLLYSLLAAYIAGGSDFLRNLLATGHIIWPSWLVSILFTTILGYVVYQGIHSVDMTNRVLMFAKFGAFIFLVGLVSPHISLVNLSGGHATNLITSITVTLTSFGFATIIPSLRVYFHNDIRQLRLAILIGSLIPLLCYIAWNLTIMGVISRDGDNGLIAMGHSVHSASAFVNQLSVLLQRSTITMLAQVFTSICLLTSFLGVALCLADFLSDGLQLEKTGKNNWIIHGATLLPPLLVVLFYPGAFIAALSYAGIYIVVLLILLPAIMAWRGRYIKNIAQGYRVPGGKLLLVCLIVLAVLTLGQSILNIFW